MEKEFIPYEQALALKELGFDEPCIKYYWTDGMFTKTYESPFNHNKRDNSISAPLYQQAFRWFREKCGLNSHIHQEDRDEYSYCCGQGYSDEIGGYLGFGTYEEAELECLKELIEIVKRK